MEFDCSTRVTPKGDVIWRLIKIDGRSQQEIASAALMSLGTLQRAIGSTRMKANTLNFLAEALDVDLELIVESTNSALQSTLQLESTVSNDLLMMEWL